MASDAEDKAKRLLDEVLAFERAHPFPKPVAEMTDDELFAFYVEVYHLPHQLAKDAVDAWRGRLDMDRR